MEFYAKQNSLSSDDILTKYTKEQFFNLFDDKQVVKEVIKRQLMMDKDDVEGFIDTCISLRNEGSYVNVDNTFYFFIQNQLYSLELSKGEYIEIVFFRFNESGNTARSFDPNSIMGGQGGSDLFNSIAGIVKKEIQNWKSEVFYFSPVLEPQEGKK